MGTYELFILILYTINNNKVIRLIITSIFEIPHFTLVEESKVFKNNVRDIYSASLKLCIFFLLKLSCVPLCTLFLS